MERGAVPGGEKAPFEPGRSAGEERGRGEEQDQEEIAPSGPCGWSPHGGDPSTPPHAGVSPGGLPSPLDGCAPAGVETELLDVVEDDRSLIAPAPPTSRGEAERAGHGQRPSGLCPGQPQRGRKAAEGVVDRRAGRDLLRPGVDLERAEPVTAKPNSKAKASISTARGSSRRCRCTRQPSSRRAVSTRRRLEDGWYSRVIAPRTTSRTPPRRRVTGASSVRRAITPSPRSPPTARSGRTRASASGTEKDAEA